MSHVFGRAITLSVTPVDGDGTPTPAHDLVSARLYRATPTREQLSDHTNTRGEAIAAVLSWADGSGASEQLVTFPAMSDPSPGSSGAETYHAVISWRFEAGGPIVSHHVPFQVQRGQLLTSQPNVTAQELAELENAIAYHRPPEWITRKVELATRIVLRRYRGLGLSALSLEQSDIHDAVLFLAASLAAQDLQTSPDDVWAAKVRRYMEWYQAVFEQQEPRYDSDGDRIRTEAERSRGTGGMEFIR